MNEQFYIFRNYWCNSRKWRNSYFSFNCYFYSFSLWPISKTTVKDNGDRDLSIFKKLFKKYICTLPSIQMSNCIETKQWRPGSWKIHSMISIIRDAIFLLRSWWVLINFTVRTNYFKGIYSSHIVQCTLAKLIITIM